MNWLEIGCPYCPTTLTLPRSAAGRSVRCPECGKVYVVPEPKFASPAAVAEQPLLPQLMAAPPLRSASAAAEVNQPRLAVDSPLPELALLDPPRATALATPAKPPTKPTSPLSAPGTAAPPRRDHEATHTTLSPRVPQMPYGAAATSDESLDEVQERIAVARRRTRMNLIVFAVGIVVMTVFAFIVVRFSRSA